MLLEPFQRLTRYPLLLEGCAKALSKIAETTKNYAKDEEILEKSLHVVKKFAESVNTEVQKEEERILYSKIWYDKKLVLGNNPNEIIALLDKPVFKLQSGIDRLICQSYVKMIDFTDHLHYTKWQDVNLTVCNTWVIFSKIDRKNQQKGNLDKNITYEIMPHPHPYDLTEFRVLDEFGLQKKQIEKSGVGIDKLNTNTDLIYRGFVEAPYEKDGITRRMTLTVAHKIIRFNDNLERKKFMGKLSSFIGKVESKVSLGLTANKSSIKSRSRSPSVQIPRKNTLEPNTALRNRRRDRSRSGSRGSTRSAAGLINNDPSQKSN